MYKVDSYLNKLVGLCSSTLRLVTLTHINQFITLKEVVCTSKLTNGPVSPKDESWDTREDISMLC